MGIAAGTGVDLLDSPVRRRIVDLLANLEPSADPGTGVLLHHEGLTAQELAGRLGLHVTTVRFHLDQLVASGILRAHFQRRMRAGRPRKLYAVEHGSLEAVSSETSYRMLSELLVTSLRPQPDGSPPPTPEEAGARWSRQRVAEAGRDPANHRPAATPGQWLAKIGRMVDLLQEWGYTPEIATAHGGRTARISLHDCPFLSLAHDNPAVVCGIHRGLMRGAMESLGEPDTDVGLVPFVGPTLCVATLTTAAPFETHPRTSPPDKEIRP